MAFILLNGVIKMSWSFISMQSPVSHCLDLALNQNRPSRNPTEKCNQ